MHLTGITIHSELFPRTDTYPFSMPVFQGMEPLTLEAPLSFFVGENGTGKSTLLRAVCRRAGIHIWRDEEKGRFQPSPYEDHFYRFVSLTWADGRVPGAFFGSEGFHFFRQIIDEWAISDPGQIAYFGGRSLLSLSHGQSLMAYFKTRYRIRGLYILDEPETALSPKTQLSLLRLLLETTRGGGVQFLIATHSPILLAAPGAVIYSFDHVPLKTLPYEETDPYKITRGFLEDRARVLEALEG